MQSLICFNGVRMNCRGLFYNEKGLRLAFIGLFIIMLITMTLIFRLGGADTKMTLVAQDKYSAGTGSSYKEPTDLTDDSLSYGIIFDCGSSGTRIYIYYWLPHSGDSHQLLDIHQVIGQDKSPMSKKISPGLSSYNINTTYSAEYLRPLLEYAADIIPKHKHKQTPLYILATAGMRLISNLSSKAILEDIFKDIPKWFDFHFERSHIQVISGREEGMYAWISLNYMLGKLSHKSSAASLFPSGNETRDSRQQTVGVIDMGGGSLQIAFEVEKAKLKNRDRLMTFNLGSDENDRFHSYSLYVTTFLGFGANSALSKYRESLVKRHSSSSSMRDNCQSRGATESVRYNNMEYTLEGTGNVSQCMKDIKLLLNQTKHCSVKPCSLDGVYQPLIPSDSHFYAVSEYWYSTYDVLDIKGYYNREEVMKGAKSYCKTPWSESEKRWRDGGYPHADIQRMRNECFKVSWITTVLHEGLHFSKDYRNLLPVNEIHGQEVQWTLGALIHKTRYFPGRHMTASHLSEKSTFSRQSQMVLPYVMLLCFAVVIGAIVLYCRHLQKMRVVPSLRSVPSMSYFMVDQSVSGTEQLELGLVQEKHYFP